MSWDIGKGNKDDDAGFDIGNWNDSMDVSFDIGKGNQDDNASFNISNGNPRMDVSIYTGNRNQDHDASIDTGNGNQCRDASFNVRDGIQNGRDAIDGVDAEVLELTRTFQSIGTEGIFQLICIHTALYTINVDSFLDVGCIPMNIP